MKSRLVVAAVIEKDGKILLGRKTENRGPYPNTWLIPGGGVEPEKESIEDAIKREIQEETSLEVKRMERIGFDEDYDVNMQGETTHYIFLLFHVEPTTDKATAGDDLAIVQWFKKSQLSEISLSRPTVKLFKKIGLL